MYYMSVAFTPAVAFLIVVVSLGVLIINPQTSPSSVFHEAILQVLPGRLYGLAVSGLLAIIMSSADSYLNSAGLLVANDVFKPLFIKEGQSFNELAWVRMVTFLIGGATVVVAMYTNNIISLFHYGIAFFAMTVAVPLVLGVLGLNSSSKSFFVSMGLSLLAFAFARVLLPVNLGIYVIPIGMMTSLVSFMVMHLVENEGISLIRRQEEDAITQLIRTPQHKTLLSYLWRYLPTPRNIMRFSQSRVNLYGESHLLLSAFLAINFMVPYFMWSKDVQGRHEVLFFLRVIGGLFCIGLWLKPRWPQFLRPAFSLFWHVGILFCLPFSTVVMYAMSGDDPVWLLNLGLFIMLLIVIVDWLSFLIIAPMGIVLGIWFAKAFLGVTAFPEAVDAYSLIYACVFSTLIGLIFARKKSKNVEARITRSKAIAKNVGHEINHNNTSIFYAAQILGRSLGKEPMDKLITNDNGKEGYFISKETAEWLQKAVPEIVEGIHKNKKTIAELKETIQNDIVDVQLEVTSLRSVIEKGIKGFSFEAKQKEALQFDLSQDFEVEIPPRLFQHVLFNLLRNAYRHGETNDVSIWLDPKERSLHFRDEGHGIHPAHMSKIFDLLYTTNPMGSGVGLAFVKVLVESFNGEINCYSEQGENSYTEFVITFPEV